MEKARKTLNSLGIRYSIFAGCVYLTQLLAVKLVNIVDPDIILNHAVVLQFALIVLSIYVIGFPVLYSLVRNLPEWRRPDQAYGTGKFFIGICKCFTINVLGSVIGLLLTWLISGNSGNAVEGLLTADGYQWLAVLVAGICAPIFEELLFRKLLIDHLAHRGKWLAIVTSGVLFGLYHGNFSQFFYATGLGLFFAYIYVTTGRIRYSIAYHMIVNLTSTVIGVTLLKKEFSLGLYDASLGDILAVVLYLVIFYSAALVGFVFWIIDIVKAKSIETYEEGETVKDGGVLKAFFTSWGIWTFLLICVYKFVTYYVDF